MKIIANAAVYQLSWFLAVLGGNMGAWFAVGLLLLHLAFSSVRMADIQMMFLLLCIGLIVDGTLHQIGFISFKETGFPIPFWLVIVWLALAITPHHCLSWLKNRMFLSAVFGALGGPIAYWAGARLGAATFNWSLPLSIGTLAVIWAALWPSVMYCSVVTSRSQLQPAQQGNKFK
jgi:hypothetical protein